MEHGPESDFARIVIGQTDRNGREVIDIYELQSGRFAVYQTPGRVAVLLAEDPLLQRIQRRRLAELEPLRSQIDGMLDAWRRGSTWFRLRDLAAQFDRRVASALRQSLAGSTEKAVAILQDAMTEIRCERESRARLQYLMWTLGIALTLLLVCLVATGTISTRISATKPEPITIWRAVSAGVLGSFYSVAVGLMRREVTNDRRQLDHFTDALVRVTIGAIAAFVLAAFLLSGAIEINFGGAGQQASERAIALARGQSAGVLFLPPWPVVLIAGFLAGFAERLVPDLLNSYTIRGRPVEAPPPPGAGQAPATSASGASQPAAGAAASRQDPEAPPATPTTEEELDTPPSPEEDVDGCDVDLADPASATPDENLPPASGGVAAQ
jgi:hypothetical protein